MTTFLVCPINGCVPGDNGTNTTPANNQIPVVSDAVGASSTIIGSATATTLNVTTPANFPLGTWFTIPTRNEKFYVSSAGGTNPLTVVRAAENIGGGPVQTWTPSAAIALNDVILTGLDVNGKAPHCPICGVAMVVADQAGKVLTLTGVAAASQVPADVDAVYVTHAWEATVQPGAAAYGHTINGQTAYNHGYILSPGFWSGVASDGEPTTWNVSASSLNRGAATVTPETLNSTLGP